MYNHLVLGQERQGGTRSYTEPSVMAKLHNSMTLGWKPLEIIPKRVKWRDWPQRHSLLGLYLPLCRPEISPNQFTAERTSANRRVCSSKLIGRSS
jgi:hypothetical protein